MSDDKPYLWKKGVSGNPSGRPKGIAQMLRDRTADLSIQVNELIRISRESRSDKTRLEAIGMIFDRVLGKALETHVTADLGAEGRLALLEGLTLDQLGELARGGITHRVVVDPPRQIGSTSVVEAAQPVLQTPETTAPTPQEEGIPDVPEDA